jgi:hypothetical protein
MDAAVQVGAVVDVYVCAKDDGAYDDKRSDEMEMVDVGEVVVTAVPLWQVAH